jgi:hypothetical protein
VRVLCDYCEQPAELVTGAVMYPRRPDLAGRMFHRCTPCGAWVGCHEAGNGPAPRDGTVPLGRLANAELRDWKGRAHAAFDPLWKGRLMRRRAAYLWLARKLGLDLEQCHIGMFQVHQCKAVVEVAREFMALTPQQRMEAAAQANAEHKERRHQGDSTGTPAALTTQAPQR